MSEQADGLLELLESFPGREVLCFRGQARVRRAEVGEELSLDGPCVATTDVAMATENFTLPGVFAVVAAGARRVVHRGRAHDGEVVLLPGTRLRVLGQVRHDRLVVTLVAGADVDVTATEVGRRAGAAIRRDLAHEPHPDVPSGRYVGEPAPSPARTWDTGALTSAERPDLAAMSTADVQAWYDTRARSAAERFREAPPGPLNPQKGRDHPHWELVGWEVRFTPGTPCVMVREDGRHPGTVRGLTEEDGLMVLAVEAGGSWVCTRADGEPWADTVDAVAGSAPQRDVPVVAWEVSDAGVAVPEGARPTRATLRTVVERADGRETHGDG